MRRLGVIGLTILVAGCGIVPPDDAVTFMVQNEAEGPIALEIIEAPGSVDRPPRAVAEPLSLEAGEQQVRIDSPVGEWALRVRGGRGFLFWNDLGYWSSHGEQGGGPDGFYVLVTADGEVEAVNHTTRP